VSPNVRLWLFVASSVAAGVVAGHVVYYIGILGMLP